MAAVGRRRIRRSGRILAWLIRIRWPLVPVPVITVLRGLTHDVQNARDADAFETRARPALNDRKSTSRPIAEWPALGISYFVGQYEDGVDNPPYNRADETRDDTDD